LITKKNAVNSGTYNHIFNRLSKMIKAHKIRLNCEAEHDRDENGAINIEMEGVSLLAGSGYVGETPVEFAATALKRGKELASLAST
jgi:transposase